MKVKLLDARLRAFVPPSGTRFEVRDLSASGLVIW